MSESRLSGKQWQSQVFNHKLLRKGKKIELSGTHEKCRCDAMLSIHYHCRGCYFNNSTLASVIQHETNRHTGSLGYSVFNCYVCNYSVIDIKAYANHIKQHVKDPKIDEDGHKYIETELSMLVEMGVISEEQSTSDSNKLVGKPDKASEDCMVVTTPLSQIKTVDACVVISTPPRSTRTVTKADKTKEDDFNESSPRPIRTGTKDNIINSPPRLVKTVLNLRAEAKEVSSSDSEREDNCLPFKKRKSVTPEPIKTNETTEEKGVLRKVNISSIKQHYMTTKSSSEDEAATTSFYRPSNEQMFNPESVKLAKRLNSKRNPSSENLEQSTDSPHDRLRSASLEPSDSDNGSSSCARTDSPHNLDASKRSRDKADVVLVQQECDNDNDDLVVTGYVISSHRRSPRTARKSFSNISANSKIQKKYSKGIKRLYGKRSQKKWTLSNSDQDQEETDKDQVDEDKSIDKGESTTMGNKNQTEQSNKQVCPESSTSDTSKARQETKTSNEENSSDPPPVEELHISSRIQQCLKELGTGKTALQNAVQQQDTVDEVRHFVLCSSICSEINVGSNVCSWPLGVPIIQLPAYMVPFASAIHCLCI